MEPGFNCRREGNQVFDKSQAQAYGRGEVFTPWADFAFPNSLQQPLPLNLQNTLKMLPGRMG